MRQAKMRPHVAIRRVPYEEPHSLNLRVSAANENQSASIEVYVDASDLARVSQDLLDFPRHSNDVALWEFGSERPEDRWGYYFRLRIFLTAQTGECAIQIRFNNNQELPNREVSEFCIKRIEPIQINRFGELLRKFSNLEHERLYWDSKQGWLS
jgi:hypothetical protein